MEDEILNHFQTDVEFMVANLTPGWKVKFKFNHLKLILKVLH